MKKGRQDRIAETLTKDVYLVWLYAILDCFLYAHAFIYTVYFLVCYFLTGYFPVEY